MNKNLTVKHVNNQYWLVYASLIGKPRVKKWTYLRGRFCFHILNNMAQKKTRWAVALPYFLSKWRIENWSNTQINIFTQQPHLIKNISMEILSKEFKPIPLEINQFENRQTNIICWKFLHVQLINILIWRAQSKFVSSKTISKKSTVNSDLDRRIQKWFHEGRFVISR